MGIRKLFNVTALIILTGIASAQSSFPSVKESEIQGSGLTEVRSFSEESLYGYIDGGAELYLEFGFDTLVVTEMLVRGKSIKVEVYRMNDVEAAFGIFSVSRYHCNGGAKLTEYFCRSAYQLQVCKGRYYISIINDTGTAEDQSISNEIANLLIGAVPETSFNPDLYFPSGVSEEAMKSAVLVRGNLGIFNGVPALSDLLESAAGYTALIIREDNNTLVSIKFDTEDGVSNYMHDQKIDKEALMRGETTPVNSGSTVSMICLQHLLIKAE